MAKNHSKAAIPIIIRGTGSFVPEEVVTNEFFASYLDTSDEWITKRTGIRTRHRAGPGESTSTMAIEASRRALDDAKVSADEIDLIVLCTATPDHPIPMTASAIQHGLGMTDIPAFDISATCSGLIYGLVVAGSLLHSKTYDTILLIGADALTRSTDYQDRSTCILFGDGAGALVLSRSPTPDRGIIYQKIGADGAHLRHFWVPAGGSSEPADTRTVNERLHFMRMRGRELFKVAVVKMQSLVDDALRETGLTAEDLAMVIPHQSNRRIIESVRTRLGLPEEKVAVNIDRYGNTSSASIALAFDEYRRDGHIGEGDLVLLVAFGAGVSWGTMILRL